MLGLFGRLSRSHDLRLLDHEVRAAGLHPVLVPEAVKLATLRFLKQAGGVTEGACSDAAALLAYCMLGPEAFADENGPERTAAVERRLEVAIESGESLDARIVLLTIHAGLVQQPVVERFGLEVE